MEICTSLSGQSFLGPCLYLSAAQVLRMLLAVVLTQQLLSILFNFVMLDFLLPRDLSAKSFSAVCQLQQEKTPWTEGRWVDNGGGRGCFFLSDLIPLPRSFYFLLTLMALLEICISWSLRMVPSRSMKYEEASWCSASIPWVALTIFRSSLFLAMYMVRASSPNGTEQYGQLTQDFTSRLSDAKS